MILFKLLFCCFASSAWAASPAPETGIRLLRSENRDACLAAMRRLTARGYHRPEVRLFATSNRKLSFLQRVKSGLLGEPKLENAFHRVEDWRDFDSPEYQRSLQYLLEHLVKTGRDNLFLMRYAESAAKNIDPHSSVWVSKAGADRATGLLREIEGAISSAQARRHLINVAGPALNSKGISPTKTDEKTLNLFSNQEAQTLAMGFVPEVHLNSLGQFKGHSPAFFRAGEIYSALSKRGQKTTGAAKRLADAYDRAVLALSGKTIPVTGSVNDASEIFMLARSAGVEVRTGPDGKLSLVLEEKPSALASRLAYLVEGQSSLSDIYAFTADLPYHLANEVVGDKAWGFREATLHDLVNQTIQGYTFGDVNPETNPVNRTYRARNLHPSMLGEDGKLLPDVRPATMNDSGNWFYAGVAPPGQSNNSAFNKEGEKYMRIFYWDGDPERSFGENARVAENWRQTSEGKWELETIEMFIRTNEERDEWAPLKFEQDKESGTWKPQHSKKCSTCHSDSKNLVSSFGPRPKLETLSSTHRPFSHGWPHPDRVQSRQSERSRN